MKGSPARIRKVDLASDSLLYFVHIPKTAGTSMRRYLDRYFLPQQVFPPEITVGPIHHDNGLLDCYADGALANFRLLVGHHDRMHLGSFLQSRQHPTHHLTVLRDPIDQLLSEYKMLRSDPRYPFHEQHKNLSLDAFLDHPDFPWIQAGNRQIGHLMAQLGEYLPTDFEDGGFQLVRAWLETFAAVGIHEDLERSLQLFSYIFGWLAPEEVPHLNRAQIEAPDVTDRQLARLEELTVVDRKLYDWARNRFQRQYADMLSELGLPPESGINGPRLHQPEGVDPRRQVRSAINGAADLRRQERISREEDGSLFEVIETDGFHPAHLNREWRRYIQWIGPRPEATVKLAFRRATDCLLYLRVDYALKKKMLDHFTVRLNGQPIPLQWTPAGAAHHFVGFVPRQLISQSRGSTVLTLKTSSVASPAELHPGATDTEVKCLAISSIDFRPAVAAEPLDAPARRRMPVSDQPIFRLPQTNRRAA